MYAKPENSHTYSPPHSIFHSFGHVLYIARSEHIVLGMVIALNTSQLVGRVYHGKIYSTAQIFLTPARVLLQIPDIYIDNDRYITYLCDDFAHFLFLFFAQSRVGGWCDRLYDTFLFKFVSLCTSPIFQQSPCQFSFSASLACKACVFAKNGRLLTNFGPGTPVYREQQLLDAV